MEKGYTAPRTGPLSVYETQAQSPSRFQRFSPGSLFSLLCCVRFSRSRARGEERRDCASPPNRPFSLRAMLRPKRKHVFSLSFWLATFRRFLDLAGRMRKLFAEDMGRPPRMQRLAPTRLLFLRSASPVPGKAGPVCILYEAVYVVQTMSSAPLLSGLAARSSRRHSVVVSLICTVVSLA